MKVKYDRLTDIVVAAMCRETLRISKARLSHGLTKHLRDTMRTIEKRLVK